MVMALSWCTEPSGGLKALYSGRRKRNVCVFPHPPHPLIIDWFLKNCEATWKHFFSRLTAAGKWVRGPPWTHTYTDSSNISQCFSFIWAQQIMLRSSEVFMAWSENPAPEQSLSMRSGVCRFASMFRRCFEIGGITFTHTDKSRRRRLIDTTGHM